MRQPWQDGDPVAVIDALLREQVKERRQAQHDLRRARGRRDEALNNVDRATVEVDKQQQRVHDAAHEIDDLLKERWQIVPVQRPPAE